MDNNDKRLNEVIRVHKRNNNFVMMDKGFLENANLSWKAKGILAYLLSKPDDWKVIISNIVNQSTDGKGAVYNGLSELKENGYYVKTPVRGEKGVIVRWDSVVSEVPNAQNTASYPLPKNQEMDNQEMDNQEMDNQEMDNPCMENRTLLSNDLSNTDFNKNQSSQSEQDGQDRTMELMIDTYVEVIKENIGYEDFTVSCPNEIKLIDEIIAIIIDAIMTEGRTICIGGENKPRVLVSSTLLKLHYENIEFVIEQFKTITVPIKKKKQYILTMLYNSRMECDSHYTNLFKSVKQ